jgi:hypothetical protein
MFPDIIQIDYLQQNWIGLTSFSASGSTGNPTTAIATALNTAGKNGTVLPNQVSSSTQMGFVNAGNNTVLVYNTSTKELVRDGSNNAVYGRLTGVNPWTVSYYTVVGSTETAYSFSSATNIDLFIPYVYQAGRMPIDINVRTAQYAGNDLGVVGSATQPTYFAESITIATDNTIPALTKAPSSTSGKQNLNLERRQH